MGNIANEVSCRDRPVIGKFEFQISQPYKPAITRAPYLVLLRRG
jgi:hypothetical protein